MPTYKFQYFDGRGRGEIIRYVFHAADKDFEDIRYDFPTWATIKESTPFGQIPVLTVDGKKLAQSGSIARYLAREFGLAGKTSWDQALIDQYMSLAGDLFKEVIKFYFEKDEGKKKELLNNLEDELYPKFCGFFQNALEKNGGNYFVGSRLTLGDLAVIDIFDTPLHHSPKLMDAFPKLQAHRKRILALPNLATYVQKRKVTDI